MTFVGQEKPSPEELAHFGVRGMKWGVRRGNLAERSVGILSDANQRQTAVLTRAREKRGVGIDEKLSRGIGVALAGGTERYNKRLDTALERLKQQRKRVAAGKLKANDILQIAATFGIGDLLVSVRDNRG